MKAVAGLAAGLALGGCLGFPAVQVRDSTFDGSPVGKYLNAISSFGTDLGGPASARWFNERCPQGPTDEMAACAINPGFGCSSDQDVFDCRYDAQMAVRRTDGGARPEMREWRTVFYALSVHRDGAAQPVTARFESDVKPLLPRP